MADRHYSDRDADIDLGGLLKAIWRRRMLVLMSTVVVGGIAFAGANMVSPRYESETQILIETRTPDFARNPNTATASDPAVDEAGIASQVALLQSVDLIKQVAKELELSKLPEFDPSADPSLLTRILVLTGLLKNPLDVPPEERVIAEFTRKLEVYQVNKARVVAVKFSSKDPALAAAIPNEMARVYLALQSGAKLNTDKTAASWLEPEIANLREKVREAEKKVADYRASADLFRTSGQSTFSEQQLNDISAEIARVRGERANAEARAESVRNALKSGRDVETLADVVGSPMIQRLKETQSTIDGQIADLSTQLLENHPRLKGLRSQREGIGRQIRQETQKILSSLESEAEVARSRERELLRQLNTLKAETANSDEKQVGLNALEREAVAQRQLLETYLARYREAVSRQDMNATPADARIVSKATMPTLPYFPKVLPITIVAALAGFLLSSVFVMIGELFSGRALRPVRYEDDYAYDDDQSVAENTPKAAAPEPEVNAPEVAIAPEASVPEPRPASIEHKAPAESLLSMELEDTGTIPAEMQTAAEDFVSEQEFSVSAVAMHLIDNNIPVAVAVSPTGDNGSTATVVLARAIAATGRRTILIDMTGSALPTRLMAESRSLAGITDLLMGDVSIADTLHADRLSDAHILPHGTADARQAMRAADRLAMIIDALSEAYDMVLVECGPAGADGVKRLARAGQAEIVLSAANASTDTIEEVAGTFIDAGYEDVILLLGNEGPAAPNSGRKAA